MSNSTNSQVVFQEELERVRELLPWYANHSLNTIDSIWLKEWLNTHQAQNPQLIAELKAEIEWIQLTITQIKANVTLPESTRGLSTLLQRIQVENITPDSANIKSNTRDWWRIMLNKLRSFFEIPAVGMSFAALVLVQFGVIGAFISSQSSPLNPITGASINPDLIPLTEVVKTHGVLFKITFLTDTTEESMRIILNKVDATIISGPGALGVYTIRVPEKKSDAVLEMLKQYQQKKHVIDSVQKIP